MDRAYGCWMLNMLVHPVTSRLCKVETLKKTCYLVIQCKDTSDQHFFSFILKSCQQQNFLYPSIFNFLGGHSVIFHSPSKLTMLVLPTSNKSGVAIDFSDNIAWLKHFVMTLIRHSEERIQTINGVPRGIWGVQTPPPQKFLRPSKIVPNSTRL